MNCGILHSYGRNTGSITTVLDLIKQEQQCMKKEENSFIFLQRTDVRHLTMEIHSEKCVIRLFCHCANMYLHKTR